jgi:GT2 family glycosyltransferase
VLSHNRREQLLACLEALRRTLHPHIAVAVVDNGSTDGSAKAVARAFPDARLIVQPRNLGVAGGRNAGLAWALAEPRPEWLLFIDDDTLVEPGSVGALVAAGRDRQVGLVAPKVLRQRGDSVLMCAGGMRFNPWTGAAWDVGAGEIDRGQRDRPMDVQACPGCAFFVRRSVIERIGGFDERFNPYGWEDVDLSLRAGAAGFRLIYAPEAVVHHRGGRLQRGSLAHYERHKAANLVRLVRLHASPPQRLAFWCLLPLRACWHAGRELSRGNAGIIAAWVGGLLGAGRR